MVAWVSAYLWMCECLCGNCVVFVCVSVDVYVVIVGVCVDVCMLVNVCGCMVILLCLYVSLAKVVLRLIVFAWVYACL